MLYGLIGGGAYGSPAGWTTVGGWVDGGTGVGAGLPDPDGASPKFTTACDERAAICQATITSASLPDGHTGGVGAGFRWLLTYGPICEAEHYRAPLELPFDPPVPQNLDRLSLVDHSQ